MDISQGTPRFSRMPLAIWSSTTMAPYASADNTGALTLCGHTRCPGRVFQRGKTGPQHHDWGGCGPCNNPAGVRCCPCNDIPAVNAITDKAHMLGIALANYINIICPDKVILAGLMVKESELYYDTAVKTARARLGFTGNQDVTFQRLGSFSNSPYRGSRSHASGKADTWKASCAAFLNLHRYGKVRLFPSRPFGERNLCFPLMAYVVQYLAGHMSPLYLSRRAGPGNMPHSPGALCNPPSGRGTTAGRTGAGTGRTSLNNRCGQWPFSCILVNVFAHCFCGPAVSSKGR